MSSIKVSSDSGLIFSEQQLIDLVSYVQVGITLPCTQEDFASYLSFGLPEDSEKLKANDLMAALVLTRKHAEQWSRLVRRIVRGSSELKGFGEAVGDYGKYMERIYSEIKSAKALDGLKINTLADYKKVRRGQGKLLGFELEPDTVQDKKLRGSKHFELVCAAHKFVCNVKKDLDAFSGGLREEVIPGVNFRLWVIMGHSYSDEIKLLRQSIYRRADEIDRLIVRFEDLSGGGDLSLFLAGFNILAIPELNRISSELAESQKKQFHDIERQSSMLQTLRSIERVAGDIQYIDEIAIKAELAVRNLVYLWNIICRYLAESVSALSDVKDEMSIRRFTFSLRAVVYPWIKIQQDACALLQTFREVDEQYRTASVNQN